MKSKSKDTAIRRIRPIALGVAIASILPLAAQAAVIEIYAESSYSMGGVPPVTTLIDGPRTSGYVDVLAFQNNGPNSIGLHSYGSTAGDFGSRSSGAGIYDVSGLFRIRESLTNTTGSAAAASFNFNITPGILSNEIRSAFGAGDFVQATISFEVIATRTPVSGPSSSSTVWSSSASLVSNETTLGQFSTSGDDTGFYVLNPFYGSGVYYDVQSFSKTLDLGLLNPGETLELKYEIKSSAQGQSTAGGQVVIPGRSVDVPGHWEWTRDWFSNEGPGSASNGVCSESYGEVAAMAMAMVDGYGGYGGYGGNPGSPPTDSPCWVWHAGGTEWIPEQIVETSDPSGSQASSGDPFFLDLSDPNFNSPGYYAGRLPLQGGLTLASVPEPGALSLLGLGLMAGWLSRRKKT